MEARLKLVHDKFLYTVILLDLQSVQRQYTFYRNDFLTCNINVQTVYCEWEIRNCGEQRGMNMACL